MPLPTAAHVLKGRTLVLAGTWSAEFFHFFTETLGKLYVFLSQSDLSSIDTIVVDGSSKRFVSEVFSHLGLRERLFQVPSVPLLIEDAFLPSYAQHCGWLSRELDEYLNAAFANVPAGAERRIYLAGRKNRRPINEREISERLKANGFFILNPEEFSLIDQISFFKGAEMIIAPHGGALTNMIFSERLKLLELFGHTYVNACYSAIARLKSFDYSYFVSENALASDYEVPLTVIDAFLAA